MKLFGPRLRLRSYRPRAVVRRATRVSVGAGPVSYSPRSGRVFLHLPGPFALGTRGRRRRRKR
jgi:hypothetical protein